MKTMTKKLISTSSPESEYFENKQDKFELVSCPRKEMICQEHLSVVNKCYAESDQYFMDKDFNSSIDTLKEAFYKTTELVDSPCTKCALAFRSAIAESLEYIHYDLEKMTSGFFGKKSYKPSCTKASEVLNEFEKFELHKTFQENKLKERFIDSYSKRNVS